MAVDPFRGAGFTSPLVRTRGDYKPSLFVGKMRRMDRRAQIWTPERLEEAALDEAVRRGGNKRLEFQKRRNNKSDDALSP